ncbi:calpain-13 [Carlito syrichta]|uniref:Calpain-13 n=1 Tax=Carlito syrichta TaxID=1868482 RepID=A0A1U7TFV0_CARSF|nr:calpain-13 [Carlito syrichta]
MAHHQEPLTESPIIRFKDQDFEALRHHYLSQGQLFRDETFPAVDASIGQKLLQEKQLSNLKWKRPRDLSRGLPHFILDGASRFDIQQGGAGDCWFLAALGSLTQNPRYLQKILMDQSFSHQYAGIFRFRFWQCGQWVEVVIDDYLPVVGRNYLFVRPYQDTQEFWPCLLEKAYAKLHGSYSQLHYGYIHDSLVDLTGGVVTSLSLHSSPSNLVMAVKTAARVGALMACTTPQGPTDKAMLLASGLVSQHAYTVTAAEKVQSRQGWEDIICLWNPWGPGNSGISTEWRGRWSDGSREWQETRDPRKSQLYEDKKDGEFWMSCQDFQENFSSLVVCSEIPITLDHGNTLHERWSQVEFKNQVVLGQATGRPQDGTQYFFSMREQAEGTNAIVSFTVASTPPSQKAENMKFPLIFQVSMAGSFLFKMKLPPTFFSLFRNAVQGIDHESKRNFTRSFHLSPGTYVVVAWARRETTQFLLRIFLKMPDGERSLSGHFNLEALKESLPEHGTAHSVFYRYAQQRLDLDATQLQRLLNQEILTGPPEDTFSLDECRSIVALMDLKVDGRLDQEEFARLWTRLIHCQGVFQKVQRSPGVLLSSDLRKAVENADFLSGILVNDELLDRMALRYGDDAGRVSFPSLACFLMRLEAMAKAFRNLTKDGRGIYLMQMEWLNLVMYN